MSEIKLVNLTWPAPLMEGLHVGAVIEPCTVFRVSEESIPRIGYIRTLTPSSSSPKSSKVNGPMSAKS